MKFDIKRWSLFLLACLILVPILIYISGGLLVGPYEGDSGLSGLVSNIYGDALSGKLSALFLLLSPMLLVLVWVACARLRSSINSYIATKA